MSAYIFSIIITVVVFFIGAIILGLLGALDVPPLIPLLISFSCLIGILFNFSIKGSHLDELKPSLVCVEKYIENSTDINDSEVEKEIKNILNEIPKEQKRKNKCHFLYKQNCSNKNHTIKYNNRKKIFTANMTVTM